MTETAALLRRAGLPTRPLTPLAGGDVARVVRCGSAVVKTRAGAPDDFFAAEARGLAALDDAGARVPRVLHVEAGGIVLEWLEPGPADWEGLAAQMARLHRHRAPGYGGDHALYLGSCWLPGGREATAAAWLMTGRIRPLIQQCGSILGAREQAILDFLRTRRLVEEGPVQLHGDLWSGNVHMTAAGAALIDPSAQWGERAYDLAMMRLFGGFPRAFWSEYERLYPIPAEVEHATSAYQLVFVLAHVAMFGAGYLGSIDTILGRR